MQTAALHVREPVTGTFPSKTQTQSQTRQFGQNLTNIAEGNTRNNSTRQKRRLEEDTEERPLKRRRQTVQDVDGDVLMPQAKTPARTTKQVSPWDASDVDDELHCIEYIDDMMEALFMNETLCQIPTDFMRHQTDVNARMRKILLDWLVEVNLKFKLRDATFYLAINVLDRFLASKQVHRSQLQLVGCACFWIAAKYHEIYAPEMGDFVYMSDNAFNRDDMLQLETDICKQLGFNLTVPTPLSFAERFLKIGIFGLEDKEKVFVKNFTFYLIEHSLMDYSLCRELPSKLAAGSLSFSLLIARVSTWDSVLAEPTRYSLNDLLPLMEELQTIITNPKCKHRAVRKKYSHSKFGKVEGVVKKYAKHLDIRKLIASATKSSSKKK